MADIVPWLMVAYAGIFFLSLFNKKFRDSFLDWMHLKDVFGIRFWSKNIWFLALSVSLFVAGGLAIYLN